MPGLYAHCAVLTGMYVPIPISYNEGTLSRRTILSMCDSRTVNMSHNGESAGFDVYPCVADACDTDTGMDSGTFHLCLNRCALMTMFERISCSA